MKALMNVAGIKKVDHWIDGVTPESVEGATLGINPKASRGQSPQKGRKPMNRMSKRMLHVACGGIQMALETEGYSKSEARAMVAELKAQFIAKQTGESQKVEG